MHIVKYALKNLNKDTFPTIKLSFLSDSQLDHINISGCKLPVLCILEILLASSHHTCNIPTSDTV